MLDHSTRPASSAVVAAGVVAATTVTAVAIAAAAGTPPLPHRRRDDRRHAAAYVAAAAVAPSHSPYSNTNTQTHIDYIEPNNAKTRVWGVLPVWGRYSSFPPHSL